MNIMIKKFLVAGNNDVHLRQPGFVFSACGPFAKKQNKNTKIQGDRRL